MHAYMHAYTYIQTGRHTYIHTLLFLTLYAQGGAQFPALVSLCINPVCLVVEKVDMGFSGSIRVSLEEGYVYCYIAVYSMIISKH